MMSDYQRETDFLRQCILYDASAGRQALEEEIIGIQSDARCVRRMVWLMAMLEALVLVGLGYGMLLGDNFPYNAPQFVVNLVFALGVGSLVSLLALAGLGMIYRRKLDLRREDCRQMVISLLETRLGNPADRPWRTNSFNDGNNDAVEVPTKNLDPPANSTLYDCS